MSLVTKNLFVTANFIFLWYKHYQKCQQRALETGRTLFKNEMLKSTFSCVTCPVYFVKLGVFFSVLLLINGMPVYGRQMVFRYLMTPTRNTTANNV